MCWITPAKASHWHIAPFQAVGGHVAIDDAILTIWCKITIPTITATITARNYPRWSYASAPSKSILLEKRYIEPAALDELIETYEKKIGPRNGARVVAKAWVDRAFRKWLLTDGTAAIGSLGYGGRSGNHLVALENTPSVHNIVVCTLCSCYPWAVLGLPPLWYKSAPYRSRTVAEPRSVLREFGVELPDDTEIRVWDSTAELRYLVIPLRPESTDNWNEEQLAELVTRDSMIGTGVAKRPQEHSK